MVNPLTHISKRGVNSPKFAPLFLLSPHTSHDASGTQQVDPLQTLYKRTKPHPTKVRSTIHSLTTLVF